LILALGARRRNLGRGLLALGLGLLLLFSNKAVSTWLILPLEQTYPPLPEFAVGASVPAELAACRFVVVLGGGHGDTPGLAALNKLSTSARARLTEGVRLLRVLPDAKLVVSGRGAPDKPTHAAVLAEAAISLGVERARIVQLDSPRDTAEEAAELASLVGASPFALVSSAWHLPRATALMRHAGLQPLSCPTDYTARPSLHRTWSDYTWDTESLGRSTWAVHERIGYAWGRLRGLL
ncbi:MAG TPA: ElyC/SanA/YdcF family protein, partial [Opitutus sp.]|nr:ElyC/SanA/YdcF family protein [Opitutus sp.]